jgi:hypothetical protein
MAQGICESDKRKRVRASRRMLESRSKKCDFVWESIIEYCGSEGSTTEEGKACYSTAEARALRQRRETVRCLTQDIFHDGSQIERGDRVLGVK